MKGRSDEIVRLPYQHLWNEASIAAVLQMGPQWLPRLRGRWDARLRRLVAAQVGVLAAVQFLADRGDRPQVEGVESALPTLVRLQWQGRIGWLVTQWVDDPEAWQALQRHPWPTPPWAILPWQAREMLRARGEDRLLFVMVLAEAAPRRHMAAALHPVRPVFWMPRRWQHPPQGGLQRLVVKSERALSLQMYGVEAESGRLARRTVALAPGRQVSLQGLWKALHALETFAWPEGRLALKREAQPPLVVLPRQWANIWLYGREVWLLGEISWRAFWRAARYVRRGQVVFPHGGRAGPGYAIRWERLQPLRAG